MANDYSTAGSKHENYGQMNIKAGILPKEMDMIAAYIFGYQKIKDAYGRPMMFFRDVQTRKVITPYERIIHAIRALCQTEFIFKYLRYDKNDNQVFCKGRGAVSDDEQAETEQKWNAILKWDLAYLNKCLSDWGAAVEKLGFQRCEIPPIALTESTGKVNIETVGTEKHDRVKEMIGSAKPKMKKGEEMERVPDEVKPPDAPKRGRPKKAEVEAPEN